MPFHLKAMWAGMCAPQSGHVANSVITFGGIGLIRAIAGSFLLLQAGQMNLSDGIYTLFQIFSDGLEIDTADCRDFLLFGFRSLADDCPGFVRKGETVLVLTNINPPTEDVQGLVGQAVVGKDVFFQKTLQVPLKLVGGEVIKILVLLKVFEHEFDIMPVRQEESFLFLPDPFLFPLQLFLTDLSFLDPDLEVLLEFSQ